MGPVVEISSIAELDKGVSLGLPVRLGESGALQLVARFKELLASGTQVFVLDFSQTQQVSEAGIGVVSHLLHTQKERVLFLNPQSATRRLFKQLGIEAPLVASMEEAKAYAQEVE